MSGSARSKVDLHLANCRELIRIADIHGDHTALGSSMCLQFEVAFGFYLMELLEGGRNSIFPWPVSEESLSALARQFDAPDLKELGILSQDDNSWLCQMLKRLAILRRYQPDRTIKAEIFRSDLVESDYNQVIVSSREEKKPGMDVKRIAMDLEAFESLLRRQRLEHEEY